MRAADPIPRPSPMRRQELALLRAIAEPVLAETGTN